MVPAIWLMSDCSAANSCWLAASDVASLVAPFAEESASWSIVCRMDEIWLSAPDAVWISETPSWALEMAVE